ncbi:MAG: RagB/SusD family nutrient uptake outer membrane protein [Tannerellaceae bacterium]|nr:RagB/SusD family nutrient uptake outer membrane protein [Tannerellaceae bacterium]
MKHRLFNYIAGLLLAVSMLPACTDLSETVYDRLTEGNFYQNEADIIAAIIPVYTEYRGMLEWRKWWDFEETTDIVVTPRAAWFDGGIYIRLHKHTWRPEDPHFSDLWGQAYAGISNSNRVIYQLERSDFEVQGKDGFMAELEVARAYWYYILCEAFGNVPIVDRFDVPEGYLPETNTRKEVYEFIESSLVNNIDKLNDDVKSTYGRFNKWNAKMLLARLYLNAESWIGVNKYKECMDLCTEILGSGKYALESDYSAPFYSNNEHSTEIMFAYPADEVKTNTTIYMALQKTLHPSNVQTFNLTTWLDNGVCAVPDFINTYTEGDKRLEKTWRMGQQYGSDGSMLYCTGLVAGWEGRPLIYTNEISSIEDAGEAEGYRCGKYEIKMGTGRSLDNDWVAMRYAEVYYMKAECILRTHGDAQEAASLVNEVRRRAFDNYTPLTGQQLQETIEVNGVPVQYGLLLKEWGIEFALEGLRRSQLIRFDNNYIKGNWLFHDPSGSAHLNIFPIPFSERQANTKLKQNEGYTE